MAPPPPPPTSTPPPPARAPVLPRPAHHDSRVRLLRAARQRAHSFAADGNDEFDHDRDHAAVAAAAAHVAVAIGMGHDQRDDKQHLLQAGGGRDTGRWLALPSATAADDRHYQLHRRHSSHLGTSTTPPTRGSPRPRPRSATSTCTCASASAAAVAALPLALSQETLDRVEQSMAARLVADSQPPSPPSTTMLDLRLAAHDAPARAPPTLAAAAGLIAERRQAALPLPLALTPRASALPPEPASSTTTLSVQDSAAPLTPPMMPHLAGPAPPPFPGGGRPDASAGPSVAALQDELRLAAEVGQALLAQHEHAAHQLATLQRAHTLLAADRDALAVDRDDLRRARDTLIDQLRAAHAEIDRLRSALAAAESAAATHQRSLAATSHHLAATTAKLAAATDAEAATRTALDQLEEQLDEARAALRRASADARTHRDAAQTAAKERDAANEALAAAEANVHRVTILATAEQARANDLDAVARQAVAERDAAVAQLEQVLDLLAAAQQGQPGGASPRSDGGRSLVSTSERATSPTSGYGSSSSAPRESDGSDAEDPDARRGRSRWLAARASYATLDLELSRSDKVMSPPPQPPPSEEEEERSVWTPAPVAERETRVPPTPPTEHDEGEEGNVASRTSGSAAAAAAVVPGVEDAPLARTRSHAPSIDDDQATSDGSDAEPDAEPGGGDHDVPVLPPPCVSTPLPDSEPTAAAPPTPTPTPPCAHCAAWAHTTAQLAAALRDLQAQIADADPVALARARKRDDPTSTPPLDAMYAQADRALAAIAEAARALPSQLAAETTADAVDLVSAVADHVAEAADAKRAFHDVARAYVTVLEQKAAAASSSSGSPASSEKNKKRASTVTSSSGGSQTSTGAASASSSTRKWVAWLGAGSRGSPALTSASLSPPPPVPPLPVRRSPSPATTTSDRSRSPLAGKSSAVRTTAGDGDRWAAVAATASLGNPHPRGRPARSATAPAVPSPGVSPSSSTESVTAGAVSGWRPARWIRGLRRRGSEEEDEPVVGTTSAVVVVGTGAVAQAARPHAAVTNTWGGEVRATMGP